MDHYHRQLLPNGVLRCSGGESLLGCCKISALLSGLAGVTVYEDPEGGSLSLTIHGHVFEGVSRKKDLKADILNGDMLKEKRLYTRRESENTISIGRG